MELLIVGGRRVNVEPVEVVNGHNVHRDVDNPDVYHVNATGSGWIVLDVPLHVARDMATLIHGPH